jgi:hypothetical protein
MAALPASFGADEILSAAKLNLYADYMDDLPTNLAESAGEWIIGGSASDQVYLSRPITAYDGKIHTIVNNSNNDRLYRFSPKITVTDAEAVLFFLDARIHTVSGASGSIVGICQDGSEDTFGTNSQSLQNNSTTSYRGGIQGLYDLPVPGGEQTISVYATVPNGTTFVCAQRRLTIIKIAQEI